MLLSKTSWTAVSPCSTCLMCCSGGTPVTCEVVALLKKEKPEAIEVQVDLVGFSIPDEFVIGYGLDYAGKYRNLPYVAVLDPRIYTRE